MQRQRRYLVRSLILGVGVGPAVACPAAPDALQALRPGRVAARGLRPDGFDVWVTHPANFSALTGAGAGMGEAVVVSSRHNHGALDFFQEHRP
jgi:hypothetical protein